jgi:hypothetical protein
VLHQAESCCIRPNRFSFLHIKPRCIASELLALQRCGVSHHSVLHRSALRCTVWRCSASPANAVIACQRCSSWSIALQYNSENPSVELHSAEKHDGKRCGPTQLVLPPLLM